MSLLIYGLINYFIFFCFFFFFQHHIVDSIIKIFNRFSLQKDLFTVYLCDLNYNKINKTFNKYPMGEIIIKINDLSFNNSNYKFIIDLVI